MRLPTAPRSNSLAYARKVGLRSGVGSYDFGGTIHVSGIGMPSAIIAQYVVCFSIDCTAHGLLSTYKPSIRMAFLIHSRLV